MTNFLNFQIQLYQLLQIPMRRVPVIAARWWVLFLILVMPVGSQAQESDSVVEETDEQEQAASLTPQQQHAAKLFEQGKSRYAVSDYLAAIDLFSAAITALPDVRSNRRALNALMVNLGRTHVRAYEINIKKEHLRMAKDIFGKILRDPEKKNLDPKLQHEIEKELKHVIELLEPKPVPIPDSTNTTDQRSPESDLVTDKNQVSLVPSRSRRKTVLRPFGWSVFTLGVLGGAAAGTMLVLGEQSQRSLKTFDIPSEQGKRLGAIERGLIFNRIALVAGIAGGVTLVAGVTMLLFEQFGARKYEEKSVHLSLGQGGLHVQF